jgi:ankyrin repeat protein
VEAYLLGERSALRALPQPRVYLAFEAAASGGRLDTMCELLCARPDDVGDLGYHLGKAAAKGQLGAMELLIAYGAALDAVAFGNTPLGRAVESGQIDAVSLLLGRGADVNKDAGGRGSPLW